MLNLISLIHTDKTMIDTDINIYRYNDLQRNYFFMHLINFQQNVGPYLCSLGG